MIRATCTTTDPSTSAVCRSRNSLAWLLSSFVAAPVAAVAFLAAPLDAQAQERRLEEVVVTAQKREESLQDAPLAVTSLSSEDLKTLGVIEIGQATKAAPNFTLRRQTVSHSNYAYAVRGVSAGETSLAVDSVVGLYIDGVYLGRMTGSAFDIADTERIEILRGPQGTLYGRNAVGGAINIITKKPQGEFAFGQDIQFDNKGQVRSQSTIETGTLNLGLAEVAMRVSYAYWEADGHVDNIFRTGLADDPATPGDERDRLGNVGFIESNAIKFSLHGDLGFLDGLSIDYSYDYSKKDGNPQTTQMNDLNTFSAVYAAIDEDGDGTPGDLVAQGYAGLPNSAFALWAQADVFDQATRASVLNNRFAGPEASKQEGHAVTLTWEIGDNTTLKYIGSTREWSSPVVNTGVDFSSFYYDGTGQLLDVLGLQDDISKNANGVVDTGQLVSLFRASRDSKQEQSTHELQALGHLFDDRLDYVLGLYFFEEEAAETHSPQYTVVPGPALPLVGGVPTAFDASTLISLGTPAATANAITFQGLGSGSLCGDPDGASQGIADLSAVYGLDPNTLTVAKACLNGTAVFGGTNVLAYTTDNEALAFYTHLNYALRDDMDLAVGLRYTEDDRAATWRYSGVKNSPDEPLSTVPASVAFDKLTWDVALSWQLTENHNLYGRAATGYRTGGFNIRAPTEAAYMRPFASENSTSYEIGLKGEWLENTLRMNMTWYYTIYKDRQLSTFSPSLAGATSIISNAGEQINQGWELEATFLTPIDGLTVGTNYGYVDANFSKEPADATRLSGGNAPPLPGGEVPYAPRHTLFAWFSYEWPDTPIGSVSFRMDYDYAGKWTLSPAFDIDHPVNAGTERGLINMRISFADIPTDQLGLPGEFRMAFFGKNITGEEYKTFIIPFGIFNLITFGDLASWGMEAAYRF